MISEQQILDALKGVVDPGRGSDIVSLGRVSEIVIKATQPLLHQILGIFIPLITTNCAVLGVALINVNHSRGFFESVMFGLGAALGFSLLLIMFAAIREKQEHKQIPAPFQGAAINMITAGLLSLAFMGFTGMDR